MKKQLLFYDIEIFKEDALVIFKDINRNVIQYFHNNFLGLRDFLENKKLVGFNNHYYDDIILTKMIELWTPHQLKGLNDEIIGGTCTVKASATIDSLDCFQEIGKLDLSLKQIEANMGLMILESSVPFDIDRALTEDEFMETFKYCSYDIDTTIEIYKLRENNYFKIKERLVNKLISKRPNIKYNKAIKWNTTTISANLLLDKPIIKWSSLRGVDDILHIAPKEAVNMWLSNINFYNENNKKSKNLRFRFENFDNIIDFSYGGLHGIHKYIKKARKVKMLDVSSMYPNIIINIGALSHYTETYKEILNRRLAIKHIDKNESDTLKLVLNSVYGNLNNQYSTLYNPNAAKSVCVYGQIALYDLCKRLSKCSTIININTDGVAFTTNSNEYLEIAKQWEQDYNLNLEEDNYDLFIQKDVNNYLAISNGKFKCKGTDLNNYKDNAFFRNNSCRISDIAIAEYIGNGTPILDTILNNLDKPLLFQFILKAGPTFKGVVDKNGTHYQKVNRVFATKKSEYVTLEKLRVDGGTVKFADSPDKMYIFNDDINKIENFKEFIDINYYYQLINKKIKQWKGV